MPHLDYVYNVAYRLTGNRYDAEDLAQETFVVACRKLTQLREPERCRQWLLAILRNLYRCERGQKRPELLVADHEEYGDFMAAAAGQATPEELWASAGGAREVQELLLELPEKYRLPLILHYSEEWSYQEIATGLEMPLGTVMSRLNRGRELLKKKIILRKKRRAVGNKIVVPLFGRARGA